jgi:hypothetical protein
MSSTHERLRIAVGNDWQQSFFRSRTDLLDTQATVTVLTTDLRTPTPSQRSSVFSRSLGQGRREMLPSNSRLQRLSQAVLSRSQFLHLAAGALLPFVGLRLLAAAAPNPQLAQNGRAVAKDYLV